MKRMRRYGVLLACLFALSATAQQYDSEWMDGGEADLLAMAADEKTTTESPRDLQEMHRQMTEPEEIIEFWNRVARHYVFSDEMSNPITEADLVSSIETEGDGNGGLDQLFAGNYVDNDPMLSSQFWGIRGECRGEFNKISWTTKGEENVEKHVVERSTDGYSAFMPIGKALPANEGDIKVVYEFVDDEPGDFAYYRVKTEGTNGDAMYSDIVYLEKPDAQPVQFVNSYFDVASAEMFVEYLSTEVQPIEISIYDKIGKKVKSSVIMDHPMNYNHHRIKLDDLSAGEYQITMRQGAKSVVKKMVKQDGDNARLY